MGVGKMKEFIVKCPNCQTPMELSQLIVDKVLNDVEMENLKKMVRDKNEI